MNTTKIFRRTATMLWLPVAILVLWWTLSARNASLYFPPLSSILQTFAADWFGPRFSIDLVPSVVKFLIGFTLSSVLGIGLGVLLGMSKRLSQALDPIIQFLRSLPPPALLPFALVVFGIGDQMNVAMIVLGAIWPTLLNTIDGVRSMSEQVRDMARSYRLTRMQTLVSVVLPHASPQIFAGLRTSLQLSVILIVVSEMVGATRGLGFYVLQSQQTFRVTETWAGTLALGILGYLATQTFLLVERRVLSWHAGMTAAAAN